MWIYKKNLMYPVEVTGPDVRLAKLLLAQYGGPDSELSQAIQYLNQRYTMPTGEARALINDIGTEELAHWEIIGTLIYQLIENAGPEQIILGDYGSFFALYDRAPFPIDSNGVPWTAAYIQTTGDAVADIQSDLAAEQRARVTYQHLMELTDDPKVLDVLAFLREREIVHYQRLSELFIHLKDEK